ncbi:MAG TPA: DEAD/DEAH box helicase, partial [Geobacteraceae bacterium]|nr:DEAD/DEAH box helicase [Geobacteraceae bacterium]
SAVAAMTDTLARESASEGSSPRSGKVAARFATLHDQWLHRLRAADPVMSGGQGELEQFLAQVREWQRPVTLGASAPFRLCFRLEEPALEEAPWQLSYLLQDAADQSLLIPLEAAWKGKGTAARHLKRPGFHPHEFILGALGRAAAVSPAISASLKGCAPDGCALEVNGAFEFLCATAPALEQAGFVVLLPSWWSRRGPRQRLTARAVVKGVKSAIGQGLSLDEIIQFNWELALGDETITLKELQELARLKSPLVKIRGQWIQVGAEEIKNAIEFLKKRGGDAATAKDLLRMAMGQGEAPGGIDLAGVRADGWFGELLAQLQGGVLFGELPQPAGLHGSLRPYQLRGYSWLSFLHHWGLGACLADDMGLGKTIQTLSLVVRDRETGGTAPFLLVCPTTVIGNWQREAARFAPGLKVMAHHGIARVKGKSFATGVAGQDMVLISYGLLYRDLEALKKVEWRGVVLDEAQNIKNPFTKQAQAARALPASLRIALTGTPVANSVADLWSIMEFLNPGFLGGHAEFRRRFIIPIQARRDPQASRKLKQLTGPFILRRMKTDRTIISDLPEKNEMKVYTPLTREQASLYGAVTSEVMEALQGAEGIQRKGLVLATLMKLKQICNHPAQFMGDNSAIPGRSGKLARLTEMLEEALAEGDRALVFTQFFEMGEIIRRHLQDTFGREILFLHGLTSRKERDRMVERFQAEDKHAPPIFILSLKAGGTGLNLTAASHVFHFDRWWNPAVEDQATDRAFRIGQRRNVQVHKFVCAGTLEERIDDMIERKKELAGSIVGAGEGWLTELSTDELKELFALRPEAVE